MSGQVDEIERIPAEQNPWYWLLKEGHEFFFNWQHRQLERKSRELEKYQKIEKKFPNRMPQPEDDVDLSRTFWKEELILRNFIFPAKFIIEESVFEAGVSISHCDFKLGFLADIAIFNKKFSFHKNSVKEVFSFEETNFFESCTIEKSTFKAIARFHENKINGMLHLSENIFEQPVYIDSIKKQQDSILDFFAFDYCEFKHIFSAKNLDLSNRVAFRNSKFSLQSTFSASAFKNELQFQECVFSSNLNFINNTFSYPPDLHGCEIKGHLNIDIEQFERTKSRREDMPKWAKLKYEMNKLHLHKEEHDFFIKELESRNAHKKRKEILHIIAFRELSDYGRSILTPISWLLTISIIMFCAYWITLFDFPNPIGMQKAVYTAKTSALPFTGYFKDFSGSMDIAKNLSMQEINLLNGLRMIQSTLSTILLFLIGLGLRNQFRIK